MANTVSYLSFANTFGDWVVVTNSLARESNDFAANNYIKPTGTLFLNSPSLGLQVANNAIVAGQLQVQGTGSGAYVQNNLRVDGQVTFQNTTLGLTNTGDMVVGGSLSVGGNFIITGSTINSSNSFTLNANNIVGSNTTFNVYRGSSGANASILWNENVDQWQILNNNDSIYYKILTTNDVTSSLLSTSSNTAASAAAANTLNSSITAQNIALQNTIITANTSMKSYVDNANTSMKSYVDSNFGLIAGINVTQNASIIIAQGVDNTQNTQISGIQGVDLAQNSAISIIQGVDLTQNTNITSVNNFAGSAYTTANGANGLAAGAFAAANTKVASITGTSNQVTVTGTTTPTLSLPQNINTGASVQFGSFGVGTAASGTTGEIRATGDIFGYYSDDRLKTKLGNIENALDKLMTLNGFYYQPNETAQALGYKVRDEVGLSAQEVQKVLPEVVAPAPIDEQYLTIKYEKVIPLLVEAIKELKLEINELKKSK
jgi:hypothetical protein